MSDRDYQCILPVYFEINIPESTIQPTMLTMSGGPEHHIPVIISSDIDILFVGPYLQTDRVYRQTI